jgi:hypothetical protein
LRHPEINIGAKHGVVKRLVLRLLIIDKQIETGTKRKRRKIEVFFIKVFLIGPGCMFSKEIIAHVFYVGLMIESRFRYIILNLSLLKGRMSIRI